MQKTLHNTRSVKALLYGAIVMLLLSVVASVLNVLPFLVFDIIRAFVFVVSLLYFLWHYNITKGHVPSYERVSEGALIAAVIFNPILTFGLDLAVWIFLEVIFMWVFALYIISVRKIEKNLKEGNRHWVDIE